MEFTIPEMTPEVNRIQKTPLPPAMYHGANSFAKEYHRETTHAGFRCNRSVPRNRGTSKYGRWRSHALLYPTGLHLAAKLGQELPPGLSVERSNVGPLAL
jgi:hypothetical protein